MGGYGREKEGGEGVHPLPIGRKGKVDAYALHNNNRKKNKKRMLCKLYS